MPRQKSRRIDRVIPGLGRLAIASEATTRMGFDKRNRLITRLVEHGRLNILRAIKDRTITLTEVLDADNRNALGDLVGDGRVLNLPFWDTVDNWSPAPAKRTKRRPRTETVARYRSAFNSLKAKGPLGLTATVGDLWQVDWAALEESWGASSADWNHLRRAVSRFLSDQFQDVHHRRRLELMDLIPVRHEQPREPDITRETFRNIMECVPEFLRPAFWVMVILGLDVGEYFQLSEEDLMPETHGVKAPGKKTYMRTQTLYVDERLWPWVEAGVPAPVPLLHAKDQGRAQARWLRRRWDAAVIKAGADPDLRLKDLRHCLAQWLTDAGVPEHSVQTSMRHASPEMTRRYALRRDKRENAKVMADIMLGAA